MHWLLIIPQVGRRLLPVLSSPSALTFIAFFIILFTKEYPESLFNVMVMCERYQYRVMSYAMFLREPYPPFTFETVTHDPGDDPSKLSVRVPH